MTYDLTNDIDLQKFQREINNIITRHGDSTVVMGEILPYAKDILSQYETIIEYGLFEGTNTERIFKEFWNTIQYAFTYCEQSTNRKGISIYELFGPVHADNYNAIKRIGKFSESVGEEVRRLSGLSPNSLYPLSKK